MIFDAKFYEFKNRFFCVCEESERVCAGCGSLINELAGLYSYSLNKRSKSLNIYHIKCKKKIPLKVSYNETGVFTFCNERIPLSTPVIFSYKVIKPSNNDLSVFEAANIVSEEVTDKTVHAGRESFGGSVIGSVSDKKALEMDKEILRIEKKNKKRSDC